LVLGIWAVGDWRRRKPLAVSFAATGFALLLGATARMPTWIAAWLRAAREYPRYAKPSLLELLLGPAMAHLAMPAMVIALLGLAWRQRRERAVSPGFPLLAALALAIAVVIAPNGDAVYGQLLLVPAILLVGVHAQRGEFAAPSRRIIFAAAALAFFWPWVAGSITAVLSMSSKAAVGTTLILLPIRTAAAVPFAVLALLALRTADALRAPAAIFDVSESEKAVEAASTRC
jgi:hypothetical protein